MAKELSTIAHTQTAQQQIARALAEIFEGKSFRYWKQGKETIFVAKDLVEAAGGKWDHTNFGRTVGGAFIKLPIQDSMGRSQEVITCSAKVAVKWLTLSRLPAAEPLAEKVWDIVGRVMDGEEVNSTPGLPKYPVPQTFPEALRQLADQVEYSERAEAARIEAERREKEAKEARDAALGKLQRTMPALLTLREMKEKEEDLTVGEYAKVLSDHEGYEIGERRMWSLLRDHGIVCKSSAQPTQAAVNKGIMAVRKGKKWTHPKTGEPRQDLQAMITVVGQIEIVRILEKSGVRRKTEKDILKLAYDDSKNDLGLDFNLDSLLEGI